MTAPPESPAEYPLRRLTDAGVDRLRDYLTAAKSDPAAAVPVDLLDGPLTEPVRGAGGSAPTVARVPMPTRRAAAEYLHARLRNVPAAAADPGLWAWLSLFYLDAVCPPGKDGRRRPGALARYIPEPAYNRRYRHLLLGPFIIYDAHQGAADDADVVLTGAVDKMGDVVEQLASRQEFVSNRALLGAATQLYVDARSGTLKKGAGGKARASARRLAAVFNQLVLTWDLYGIAPARFVELLPPEFDRFRSRSASR